MTPSTHSVLLRARPGEPGPLAAMAQVARPEGVEEALAVALPLARVALEDDRVTMLDRWEALATLAAHDLGAARAIEPHLDALTILGEAGALDEPDETPFDRTWGVFAAQGGSEPLTATRTGVEWKLTGVTPWCSLASRLDAALVIAMDPEDDSRRLYAVDLRESGASVDDSSWAARGLSEIASGPVRFRQMRGEPVGDPGWYLQRPGFSWGGVGVAACWYGGAVALARRVFAAASAHHDPHVLAHLGAIDELLQSSRRALSEAADLAADSAADARLTAKRVRATVARACDEVLARALRALGPAPLALEPDFAKRVADLQLYVRQHHAERDQASLGAALSGERVPW